MDYEVLMPQFSDTMERGKIVKWLKREGEYVEKGETIAEIEAEKAIMELQSFRSGILKKILHGENEEVKVGKVIAIIEITDKPVQTKETPPKEEPKKMPEEKPKETFVKEERKELKEVKKSMAPGFASPYAKVLAKELDLDISEFQKMGKIPSPAHAKDIEKFLTERYFTPRALEIIKDYQIDPKDVISYFGERKVNEDMLITYIENNEIPKKISVSFTQKTLIENLTKSIQNPQYRITDKINASFIPYIEGITYTHWFIKIIGDSMMYFDRLRAKLKGDSYLISPNANVGVAVGIGEELYNVVIKRVNKKTLKEISEELQTLRQKAQESRLSPEDIKGATLTISNLGMFGIMQFDAILPFEQACIVAIGAIDENKTFYATFTFDHRIVNGLTGALFVKHVKERFTDKAYLKLLSKGAK